MPETINVSLQFENMLSLLFGKDNHHGDVSNMSQRDWKKNILKIINAIERSISQNISFTDNFQKIELDRIIDQLKTKVSRSASIEQTNHDTILALTKIVFNILGRLPYNWDRKNTSRREIWELNDFRTIGYTQNYAQKANLIIHLSEYSDYNEGLPPKRELQRKLYMDLKGNHIEFIEWFKENYPSSYLKIF